MDVQKQFLKLVEAKKQKVLEKKEAPLKWEQRLEMAAKAKANSKSKECDELKAHKRSRKEQNLESAAGGDDSEERKRRKKHRKHKHSNSKHSKKHNRHDFDSSSEDSEESGSDEDRRRPSHRKGGHKHHKDHSGSASDAKEDHQWPLKLSTWCKEEDISSSESFDSSDKSRGQSRKHKKEKDKPHSRSNHHHHHHHHLHHIDQIGSEQKPCAESQDKTTSEIHHCNGSIDTMPQTKVA